MAKVPDSIDPALIVKKEGQTYYPVDGELVPLTMIDDTFDEEREAYRKRVGAGETEEQKAKKSSKKSVAAMVRKNKKE